MDTTDLNKLVDQPEWLELLEVYSELILQAGQNRTEDEQGPRWVGRIPSLKDIPLDDLSVIHGELIAYGWLTFQLEGRDQGLVYRVTSEGRKAIVDASKLVAAQRLEEQQQVAADLVEEVEVSEEERESVEKHIEHEQAA